MTTPSQIPEQCRVWSFKPTEEGRKFIKLAQRGIIRKAEKSGHRINPRGLRAKLINEALRLTYGHLGVKSITPKK